MKIGLLSDIHGELNGLRAALALFESFSISTILCAGDLVNGTGHGDDVVALVQAHGVHCVMGNHDRDAPDHDAIIRAVDDASNPRFTHWLISAATLAFLQLLPDTRTLQVADKTILLTHGTPDKRMTYLFPDSDPAEYFNLIEQHSVDVVIIGHTHIPMHVRVRDSHIINPGSVYRNRFEYEGSQTCGIFDLDSITLLVLNVYTGQPVPYARLTL